MNPLPQRPRFIPFGEALTDMIHSVRALKGLSLLLAVERRPGNDQFPRRQSADAD